MRARRIMPQARPGLPCIAEDLTLTDAMPNAIGVCNRLVMVAVKRCFHLKAVSEVGQCREAVRMCTGCLVRDKHISQFASESVQIGWKKRRPMLKGKTPTPTIPLSAYREKIGRRLERSCSTVSDLGAKDAANSSDSFAVHVHDLPMQTTLDKP